MSSLVGAGSARWGLLLTAALSCSFGLFAGELTEGDRAFFEHCDYSASLPESFRAVLEIGSEGARRTRRVEMWRRGDAVLIRFLEDSEVEKFYLQLDSGLYFLAPGARRPVALGKGHRLWGGASFGEIIGARLVKEYELEGARWQGSTGEEGAEVVTFSLSARDKGVPYPEAELVASTVTRRALRLELSLPSGRKARIVEIKEWNEGLPDRPVALVVKDLLGRHPPMNIRVVELEETQLSEALFDLEDAEARGALTTDGKTPADR